MITISMVSKNIGDSPLRFIALILYPNEDKK